MLPDEEVRTQFSSWTKKPKLTSVSLLGKLESVGVRPYHCGIETINESKFI